MRHFNAKTSDVVRYANAFARSIGCGDEPPVLQASTIGKMGLKGVAGLRVLNKAGGILETRSSGPSSAPTPRGARGGFSGNSRNEGRPSAGRGRGGGGGGGRGGFGGAKNGGFGGDNDSSFAGGDARSSGGRGSGGRGGGRGGNGNGRRRGAPEGERQGEEPRHKRPRRE